MRIAPLVDDDSKSADLATRPDVGPQHFRLKPYGGTILVSFPYSHDPDGVRTSTSSSLSYWRAARDRRARRPPEVLEADPHQGRVRRPLSHTEKLPFTFPPETISSFVTWEADENLADHCF